MAKQNPQPGQGGGNDKKTDSNNNPPRRPLERPKTNPDKKKQADK